MLAAVVAVPMPSIGAICQALPTWLMVVAANITQLYNTSARQRFPSSLVCQG